MSLPPTNVPPSELWLQITQMPRPHRLVDFPRKDRVTGQPIGQIAIWVLTQEESMICQSAAEKFARNTLKENVPKQSDAQEGYANIYRNAAAVEVLWRACRRPEDLKQPAFPSPGEMRKLLTHDEVGVLMSHYNRVQTELGPYVTDMTAEELDAWIARLEEGGSRFFLDCLSSEVKEALIERLAFRLRSFSTDNGSHGEQPDVSLNDSSETTPEENVDALPEV